jgi:fructose 1,6-bisphosphatase
MKQSDSKQWEILAISADGFVYLVRQDLIKDSLSGNVRGMGPAVAELGSALRGIAGVAAMAMQIVFSLFFFSESPAETLIL